MKKIIIATSIVMMSLAANAKSVQISMTEAALTTFEQFGIQECIPAAITSFAKSIATTTTASEATIENANYYEASETEYGVYLYNGDKSYAVRLMVSEKGCEASPAEVRTVPVIR